MKNIPHMIASIEPKRTGGNCIMDYVVLNDGRMLCISQDGIGLYPSADSLDDSQLLGFMSMDNVPAELCDISPHCNTEFGYFIKWRWQDEVSNGQPADMLRLGNDTVLCIDATGIGWYKSEQAFRQGHLDGGLGMIDFPIETGWVIETDPQQLGGDRTDFGGWLKFSESGGGHIHVQFPHWFGAERAKELMRKMCIGMNQKGGNNDRFGNRCGR